MTVTAADMDRDDNDQTLCESPLVVVSALRNTDAATTSKEGTNAPFSVSWGNPALIRNTEWIWDGYLEHGALNSITGGGGAGKSTLTCWMIAHLSRGTLPGKFHGQPAKSLVLANEDTRWQKWDPAVIANGGDCKLLGVVDPTDGGNTLNTHNRQHMQWLIETVAAENIALVVVDSVLDVMDAAVNSHNQKDVRGSLAPLRTLCRETGVTCLYLLHPNKAHGQLALRDRAGGSGQFTDIGRSNLFTGFHRAKDGYRAVARGKANSGADPGAMVFQIEPVKVENPATGEQVETVRLTDISREPFLLAEEISVHRAIPKSDEPSAGEKVRDAAKTFDRGKWHPLAELRDLCMATQGMAMAKSTFEHAWGQIKPEFDLDKEGTSTVWRTKN